MKFDLSEWPLTKPGVGPDRIGSDRIGLTKPGSARISLKKPISTYLK